MRLIPVCKLLVPAVAVMLMAGSAHAQLNVYTATSDAQFAIIDLSTGLYTELKPPIDGNQPVVLGALTLSDANGTLYGVERGGQTLYSLDPISNPVQTTLTSQGSLNIPLFGLASKPITGELVGGDANGALYNVASDGTTTAIPNTAIGAGLYDLSGLTYGANNTLYEIAQSTGNAPDAIFVANTSGGAPTKLGDLSDTLYRGLIFIDGKLYLFNDIAATNTANEIYYYDLGTNTLVDTGNFAHDAAGNQILGLITGSSKISPVPEPGVTTIAASLAVVGSGLMVRRRLKR